jgi:hypothetical protein
MGTTVSVATLEICPLDEAAVASRTSGLGTGCAGVTRDDLVAAARAPPAGAGRELSSWDVALVVRVEGLVVLAAGFALVLVFIGANG